MVAAASATVSFLARGLKNLAMARNDRKRYANLGVYDPPEPSLSALDEDARARWQEAYDMSMQRFNRKEVAEATAWRTIRMSYQPARQGGAWVRCANDRCQSWPSPHVTPKPDAVLNGLGVFIEYSYVDPDGELQVIPMDPEHPPVLYWDDIGKRIYVFPQIEYASCDLISDDDDMQRAANVIRRWRKGQDPQCQSEITIPKRRLHAVGVADTVSYRSSKFDGKSELKVIDLRGEPTQDPREPGAQEYIHKHWQDVWTWQDHEDDPSVIVIEGGALDVHNKGIIH